MPTTAELMSIFQQTMSLCQEREPLKEAVAQSIQGQKIYWEQRELDMPAPRYAAPAKLLLSKERTLAAAEPYAKQGKRVCALNFANAFVPGGGVAKGSTAQEECLCRISTLYPAITDKPSAGAFYHSHNTLSRNHEMNGKSRHDCLFTPGVVVFREDSNAYTLLPKAAWYTVDIITCAAPDLRPTVYYGNPPYNPPADELEDLFTERIGRILNVAAIHEAEALILGAFGCGAFRNPPQLVARAFNRALAGYMRHFESVVFAIYSPRANSANYCAFQGIGGIEIDG